MPGTPIYKRVARKGERALRKWVGHVFPPLHQEELFPSDLIVHFSQHKCLTAYYSSVIQKLGEEFNFTAKHFQTNLRDFENAAVSGKGKRVLSLDFCSTKNDELVGIKLHRLEYNFINHL